MRFNLQLSVKSTFPLKKFAKNIFYLLFCRRRKESKFPKIVKSNVSRRQPEFLKEDSNPFFAEEECGSSSQKA